MLKKVIVIAGTTGVGKSQLSIELASRFNGEVINSDAIQVYKGIPIISNKHPILERAGIAHHVMDHVEWDEDYYMHRFASECISAINDIHKRGKLPIIVGGTHYYLQVLFDKRIDNHFEYRDQRNAQVDDKKNINLSPDQQAVLADTDPVKLHSVLSGIDAEIAQKYHPNDIRRVKRMIEIFYETGKKPSELFRTQSLELNYETLFLWLYSEPEALNKRLDTRVDSMMNKGALQELNELYEYYCKVEPQLDSGIWQVIGFKEFLPWLQDPDTYKWDESLNLMKMRTKQYAKRQVKWIQKMLIPDIRGDIYVLNATDLSKWNVEVRDRANCITEHFLNNKEVIIERSPSELQELIQDRSTMDRKLTDFKQFQCATCKDQNGQELIIVGARTWDIHINSRRHRTNLRKAHKMANFEEWRKRKSMNSVD